jgi:hypothetical protein
VGFIEDDAAVARKAGIPQTLHQQEAVCHVFENGGRAEKNSNYPNSATTFKMNGDDRH